MSIRERAITAMAQAIAETDGPMFDYEQTASAAYDAALSVLIEPDEDMIEAGQDVCGQAYVGHGLESEIADPEAVWQAMLTKAKADSV